LILISLADEWIGKRFNKEAVITKRGVNTMYSLGFLIVELESARRRLLYVFEMSDAKQTKGLRRIFKRSKN
jgi:hypothetical protein